MRKFAWFGGALIAVAAITGCDDSTSLSPAEAQRARGEYLVQHVAACIDCHTPRLANGELDRTRLLSGSFFADIVPGDDNLGAIYAPNLTPDSTGLRSWSDDQIKNAFQNGIDDEGQPLFPIMPYFVFHNMEAGDANAVVAYLRSLPAVHNEIPPRQPLGFPFMHPAQPIPAAAIPVTTLPASDAHYANATRGRYLAAMAGVCIECHSKPVQGPVPVDLDSLFAGGREFGAEELGLPSPPFPPAIVSANITPDPTGIQAFTPDDIRRLLKLGVDEHGEGICPPMPVGPSGAFGGLTNADATDIGWYVTTLPPIQKTNEHCTPPAAP